MAQKESLNTLRYHVADVYLLQKAKPKSTDAVGGPPLDEAGVDDILNHLNKGHWWWLVSFYSRLTYLLVNGLRG